MKSFHLCLQSRIFEPLKSLSSQHEKLNYEVEEEEDFCDPI